MMMKLRRERGEGGENETYRQRPDHLATATVTAFVAGGLDIGWLQPVGMRDVWGRGEKRLTER